MLDNKKISIKIKEVTRTTVLIFLELCFINLDSKYLTEPSSHSPRIVMIKMLLKVIHLHIHLKESDFLTLHVPLMPETRHYIGEKDLKLMKKTAILINASRGPVVDEQALLKALQEKQIWAAGLDVFENEPEIVDGLTKLDNVLVVPHIASATTETRINMGRIAVNNVIKVLSGQPPDTCVNPEVLKK